MSQKDDVWYRRKMLRLASKLLKRSEEIDKLCIDDFLDSMATRPRRGARRAYDPDTEESNCLKVKSLLQFFLSGIDERLEDIQIEKRNQGLSSAN